MDRFNKKSEVMKMKITGLPKGLNSESQIGYKGRGGGHVGHCAVVPLKLGASDFTK